MLSTQASDLTELLEIWQAGSRQRLADLGLVALVAIPDPATSTPKPKAKPKSAKTKDKDKSATATGEGNISSSPVVTTTASQTQMQAEPATDKTKVKYRVEILDDDELPADLDVASGMELFLATLAGKSKETVRTYRTGCRRFLTFLYTTGRGQPTHIPVNKLPISILERYHDWLLTNYAGDNSSKGGGSIAQGSTNTVLGYMAAARNLFEYLASRNISPAGAQYQRLVARLPKLQARSGGYRTPRALRTRQNQESIEQLARLAATTSTPNAQTQSALANDAAVSVNEGANFTSNSSANSVPASNPNPNPVPDGLEVDALLDELGTAAPTRRKRTHQIHDPAELERRRQEAARNRAIILALYTTGMRRHEVAALNRPELEALLALWHTDISIAIVKAKTHLELAATANTSNSMPQPAVTIESEPEPQSSLQPQTPGAAPAPAPPTSPRPVYELLIRGKGSKERFVYFDETALAAIEEYLTLRGKDGYRPLFLQHHRGRAARGSGERGDNWRVRPGTVWEIAVDFGREKLGITIRPHDFRHNLATVLLNAGAKLEEVQDLLGHSSPATTKMIYAHYSQQHLKDVFSRFRNPIS